MNYLVDLINGVNTGIVFKPQVLTTTTNGTVLDCVGAGLRQGNFITVVSGTITDGGFSFAVQEGALADGSDMAAANDFAGAAAVIAFTASEDTTVKQVVFNRTKRYVRLVCTVTGSPSTGGPFVGLFQGQLSRPGGTNTVP